MTVRTEPATRPRALEGKGPARLDREEKRAARLETVRRASECALLGAVWFAFALPVVTAGAAWAGAAEVYHAWTLGEEPPMVRTLAHAVRRNFAAGLLLESLVVVVTGLAYLEIRAAIAAHLPGALPESAALCVIAGTALAVLLLAFPARAASGGPWREAVRDSARLCRRTLWAAPLSLAAVAVAAIVVSAFPVLIVLIGGPVGYALCAVHTRASRAG